MSWRKYGAVRYGLVFAFATVFPQTLLVGPATVAITAPTAVLATPGVSVPVPYQRPVFARGLRVYGPAAPSTTPDAGGAQNLSAGSQIVVLTAPAAARVAGGVSLAAGSQVVTITAPTATLNAGTAPPIHSQLLRTRLVKARVVETTPWIASYGTVSYALPEGQFLSAGAQTVVTVSAPTVVRVAGGSTRAAGTQIVTIKAPQAILTLIVPAGRQTVTISAPTANRVAGARTLGAGTQVVTISAPATTLASGGVTRAAGSQVVTIKAPTATVSVATIRTVGSQAIGLSAPGATLAAGAVSRAAGTQVVTVAAPTAVRLAVMTRTAGTQTVTLRAPAATLTVGSALVSAGRQTLTIVAPDPRVLGATELPDDLSETHLASRLPARTIASRMALRTSSSPRSTRTVES